MDPSLMSIDPLQILPDVLILEPAIPRSVGYEFPVYQPPSPPPPQKKKNNNK